MKTIHSTLTALAILALTAGAASADAADALRNQLVGRTVVFKMEMPLLKGAVVSPDGQLDQKLYYKRIKKHRPVFTPGERAEITKVLVKGNELKICFNGCGIGFIAPGSRVMGKLDKHGSALIVSFPGAITAGLAHPERILPLLQAVATVENLQPRPTPETAAAPSTPSRGEAIGTDPAPTLELLSATVEPAEVAPGEAVTLVLQFEIDGSGIGLPVSEERQIFRGDLALLSAPRSSTQLFRDGRQRTEIEFRVPADAAPGAYTFEGVVRGGGFESRARAVFLVRD